MMETPLVAYRRTLDRATIFLKFLGVWKFESEKTYHKVYRFFVRAINWSVMTMSLLGMFSLAIHNFNDMGKVADCLGYAAPYALTLVKNVKFYTSRKEIHSLVDKAYKPLSKLTSSSDTGVLTRVREVVAYCTLDLRMYICALTAAIPTAFVGELFISGEKTPLPGYFFYNHTVSPILEITVIGHTWTMFLGAIWLISSDMVMLGVLRSTNVQFRILRSNYENCMVNTMSRSNFDVSKETIDIIVNYDFFKIEEKYREIKAFVSFNQDEAHIDNNNDSYVIRFKLCIYHQQRLMDIINHFNKLFSSILFCEIFVNCILMCLFLYEIATNLDDPLRALKYVMALVAAFLHIGYFCIFGNMITDQTEKLFQSIYSSGWILADSIEVRNLLLNSQLSSMRTVVIEAGKFFNLTLPTLLWVLQKAYAFFAVINTTN